MDVFFDRLILTCVASLAIFPVILRHAEAQNDADLRFSSCATDRHAEMRSWIFSLTKKRFAPADSVCFEK